MKYHELCPHCDQQITAYTHNINHYMVDALHQLMDYYYRTKKSCNINKDLKLDHTQMCNLPKLQYFGFIRKVEVGKWYPTQRGLNFLENKLKVTVPVATLNNEVLPDNHKAWETHKKPRKEISVRDIVDTIFEYKGTADYQKEKSPQEDLI